MKRILARESSDTDVRYRWRCRSGGRYENRTGFVARVTPASERVGLNRRACLHDPDEYRPAKLFTVEQANAALPLVRAITTDLVALSREVVERRQRLALLTSGRQQQNHRDLYSEELEQIEEELEKDGERLQDYVDELRPLGVEPKSGTDGLVDFPSLMDGRIVFLCWKHRRAGSAPLARARLGLCRSAATGGRQRGRWPRFARSARLVTSRAKPSDVGDSPASGRRAPISV